MSHVVIRWAAGRVRQIAATLRALPGGHPLTDPHKGGGVAMRRWWSAELQAGARKEARASPSADAPV